MTLRQLFSVSVFLSIFLFSSCVSKKKYTESVGKTLSCEERESQLTKRLDNTNVQLRQLTRENGLLEERIDQLDRDKEAQKGTIADLRSQIDDVTGRAMSEQVRLDQALKSKAQALEKREKVLNEMQALRETNDAAITDLRFKIFDSIGAFAEDEMKIETRDGSVVILLFDKIMFQGGQTRIRSRGKEALTALAPVLASHPELYVQVEGHTGSRGNYADPMELSVMRAAKIVNLLTKDLGLTPVGISAAGQGDSVPRFDDANNAENNRTEIILSPRFQEIYRILKRSNF